MRSVNINHESSVASSIMSFKSCVAPTDLLTPLVIDVTRTSYHISWDAPENDGGCPIIYYEIYRDIGDGGAFSVNVT